MNQRVVALLLIGFCLISIVIGIINGSKKAVVVRQECQATRPSPAFFKGFSKGGDKIALITLEGVISSAQRESVFRDFSSSETALKALNKAIDDESVKGVIFRINSPGGTVAMSQEIYDAVLKLREQKPVVVSMADVAASGGYYIASAADRIYANPGTVTGSIGVIMETIDASGLLTEKLGVKSEVIKSGKYKDIGNIYRALSPDEKTLLNNLIQNAYKQFVTAITEGRINRADEYELNKVELTVENLAKYADGRVFSGEQALEYGFVDGLGGLNFVEEEIKSLIKKKDLPVVNFNKPAGFEEFFFQFASRLMPEAASVEELLPVSKRYPRQPLFIWE